MSEEMEMIMMMMVKMELAIAIRLSAFNAKALKTTTEILCFRHR